MIMTPEEKAKAYDEALERARKELQTCGSANCDAAKQIFRLFPELKESEDDEMIKWIIDDIRYNMDNEPLNNSEYKKKAEKAIAWLEKQGEKPQVIEGAKWADKTMIEKACEWLDANFPEIENVGSWYKESFINQFKKAMEE